VSFEITIDVDDVDRAVAFYARGLGLTLVEQRADWARLALGDQTFWITALPAGPAGAVHRDYRRHWTPIHLDFIVEDIDAAVTRALAAGGRLDREIRRDVAEPLGRHDVANLCDPAGNGVDLVRRRE
jgi:catechol 2,3-dioxygenase-like lactoylglutathione lyase family enzyme